MQLKNNTILITGGASGIGLAMTKKFARLGNTIIITGRNTNKLSAVKAMLPDVHTIPCDITQQADIDHLVHTIEQQFPKLNILINNAGVQYNYELTNEPNALQKVEHEINTNLLAPIKLTTLLLPLLEQNDNAAIVNVSSALGLVPKQSAPVYCGTKAGLHIFTKALRYQLTHTKLFEIIPSLVDTDMTKGRGKGKISAEELTDEFITAFEKDKYEINIGKVKMLRLLARISPKLADNILSKG
ncbi:MAG: SDR family NAD(P)-dependent oxidoreductase [Flavipsychrobacter sp.]